VWAQQVKDRTSGSGNTDIGYQPLRQTVQPIVGEDAPAGWREERVGLAPGASRAVLPAGGHDGALKVACDLSGGQARVTAVQEWIIATQSQRQPMRGASDRPSTMVQEQASPSCPATRRGGPPLEDDPFVRQELPSEASDPCEGQDGETHLTGGSRWGHHHLSARR